jgi:CBS domain-containing protein
MTISRILATKGRDVVTAQPHRTLLEISAILSATRIGALMIVDANNNVLGILSERDIVRAIGERGAHVLDDPASRHMTTEVVTSTEDETLLETVEKMTRGRFRHMPILKDGHLEGLISMGDVVKYRLSELEREQSALREYITTV